MFNLIRDVSTKHELFYKLATNLNFFRILRPISIHAGPKSYNLTSLFLQELSIIFEKNCWLKFSKFSKRKNGIEFLPNFPIADLLTARNGSNILMNNFTSQKSATRKYCENKTQND